LQLHPASYPCKPNTNPCMAMRCHCTANKRGQNMCSTTSSFRRELGNVSTSLGHTLQSLSSLPTRFAVAHPAAAAVVACAHVRYRRSAWTIRLCRFFASSLAESHLPQAMSEPKAQTEQSFCSTYVTMPPPHHRSPALCISIAFPFTVHSAQVTPLLATSTTPRLTSTQPRGLYRRLTSHAHTHPHTLTHTNTPTHPHQTCNAR
jgi:hypothetical protein